MSLNDIRFLEGCYGSVRPTVLDLQLQSLSVNLGLTYAGWNLSRGCQLKRPYRPFGYDPTRRSQLSAEQ